VQGDRGKFPRLKESRTILPGGEEGRLTEPVLVPCYRDRPVGADEQIKGHVSDAIDPAFLRADPHVRFRARQLRAMLQRGMG